jgi:hypothetical protein
MKPDRWPVEALPPRAAAALDRVPGGMDALEAKARAFLQHVTTRAPRWYSRPVEVAEEAAFTARDVA